MIENRTSSGNVLKVVEMGLQDKVYEAMKLPKFSVEALTRQLNAEGINITSQSIRKFIRKTKTAQKELIARDLNVASEVKKLTMDYTSEIKNILEEVKNVRTTVLVEKDMASYNQMITQLFKGMELLAKLSGDIKPAGSTNVDIKVIYNQIGDEIETKMRDVTKNMFKGKIIDVDAVVEEEDKKQAAILQAQENE